MSEDEMMPDQRSILEMARIAEALAAKATGARRRDLIEAANRFGNAASPVYRPAARMHWWAGAMSVLAKAQQQSLRARAREGGRQVLAHERGREGARAPWQRERQRYIFQAWELVSGGKL